MTRLPALDRVDPWRYVCPECGSYELHTLHRRSRVANKNYAFNGEGQKEVKADLNATFRCKECSARLNRVYDKKKGREVRSV